MMARHHLIEFYRFLLVQFCLGVSGSYVEFLTAEARPRFEKESTRRKIWKELNRVNEITGSQP
jgi:hypothetical protein